MSGTKKARAETELIMSQGNQRTASLLVSSVCVCVLLQHKQLMLLQKCMQ